MKKTTLLLVWISLAFCKISLGQSSDTHTEFLAKKSQLVQQFNIYEQDHRGLVIYFSDQGQISYPVQATFSTLQQAIEAYFNGTVRRDMVSFAVSQPQGLYPTFTGGLPIDMGQSIEKYIELFNQ
ncbi:MAG: hypothetical protein K0R65_667 [Crocinitomicaceae bacterium]|jgi:hypothetical protein|nr:hypothetical protein [Crocinitomicaceae bacterium]